MKEVDKIMVCLDLTEMDDKLISYSFFLKQALQSIDKFFFVHNIKFDFPDTAQEIFNNLDKPLGEIISDEIIEKVEAYSKSINQNIDYEVVIGFCRIYQIFSILGIF